MKGEWRMREEGKWEEGREGKGGRRGIEGRD